MLGSIKAGNNKPYNSFLNDEHDELMELDPGDPLNPYIRQVGMNKYVKNKIKNSLNISDFNGKTSKGLVE